MQINTVGGECYGGRGAEEEGGQHEHGDGGGAQARHGAASPLVPPPAAASNLVHGGGERRRGSWLFSEGWEVLKRVQCSGVVCGRRVSERTAERGFNYAAAPLSGL